MAPDRTRVYQIAMARDVRVCVQGEDSLHRGNPALRGAVLFLMNDWIGRLGGYDIAGEHDFIVRKIDLQIAAGVRGREMKKAQMHAFNGLIC